ncbi:hypothetical protein cu1937 [Corynebacterium urealyticum DSM 7109]|uniref:Uncharacterized protein n=1 Tax=Corynebacterium urealyticum (strain ATCC 43042 / DSM 7109) TaxID=504474 RepID=B1VIV0_CORU7|nr:hypothetical protein cu1937 [Corynebacterium urealyticum DSM 7109]
MMVVTSVATSLTLTMQAWREGGRGSARQGVSRLHSPRFSTGRASEALPSAYVPLPRLTAEIITEHYIDTSRDYQKPYWRKGDPPLV